MVTRITGMADNHALEFMQGDNGYWEAKVPIDTDDGAYIVTLWAWDEAGNSTYYATILMIVTPSKIMIEFLSGANDYSLTFLPDKYAVRWEG